MGPSMSVRGVLVCACLLWLPSAATAGFAVNASPLPQAAFQSVAAPDDPVTRLVSAIEESIRAGDGASLRALVRPEVNRVRLSEFALSMTQSKVTRLALKERD